MWIFIFFFFLNKNSKNKDHQEAEITKMGERSSKQHIEYIYIYNFFFPIKASKGQQQRERETSPFKYLLQLRGPETETILHGVDFSFLIISSMGKKGKKASVRKGMNKRYILNTSLQLHCLFILFVIQTCGSKIRAIKKNKIPTFF